MPFGADRQADLRRRGQRRHARDQGGGSRLVEALARVIENRGGQLLTNAQVDRVLVEGQGRRARAAGVQLADGRRVRARDAVVCNVTPQQLYGQLLPDAPPPARARRPIAAVAACSCISR